MKKRLFTFVLAIILVMIAAVPVAANGTGDVVYASTQNFINELESNGIKYTYRGVNDNGREQVRVSYASDNYDSIVFNIFFSKDSNTVRVYVWNLVDVAAGKNFTLNVLNQLNKDYLYAKFYLDESDSTVTCEMEGFFKSNNDAGFITKSIMLKLLDIIEDDDAVNGMMSLK